MLLPFHLFPSHCTHRLFYFSLVVGLQWIPALLYREVKKGRLILLCNESIVLVLKSYPSESVTLGWVP